MKKMSTGKRAKTTSDKRSNHDLFSLKEVILSESQCSRAGIKVGPILPDQISIAVKYNMLRHETDPSILLVHVPIEVQAAYDESNNIPALVIKAVFILALQFSRSLPTHIGNSEAMNHYRNFALFNVWPYWRQLVQFTTVGMGIPPMRMPAQIPDEILFRLENSQGP